MEPLAGHHQQVKMLITKRIEALSHWGENIRNRDDHSLQERIDQSYQHNNWFTRENSFLALDHIVDNYLNEAALQSWSDRYPRLQEQYPPKTIGIVLAGNIPLVGFHDLLSVLISGHRAAIKLSSKDQQLLPHLLSLLEGISPDLAAQVTIVDTLADIDAIIATGGNNAYRYFHYYFGKYPHIIRKNRNSIAVLTGDESPEALKALGQDIFQYFGLGCRSISKLLLPKGYRLEVLLDSLSDHQTIMDHHKYRHNYDYNFAVWTMNKVAFRTNDVIMLTENRSISSPIASLHYEYYEDPGQLPEKLLEDKDSIQCTATQAGMVAGLREKLGPGMQVVPFGTTQQPSLWDYADSTDTLAFLCELAKA